MEDSMSTTKNTRRFHWLGSAAVAALALTAVAVPLTPAKAQVGIVVGPVGVGVGPYYGPGYYPPAYGYGYYYGPGYYHHYHGW
jgi:hypothetical protein